MMKLLFYLSHHPLQDAFEEIARDGNVKWMSAVEILDDDNFLGGDISHNLFVCQKDRFVTIHLENIYFTSITVFRGSAKRQL